MTAEFTFVCPLAHGLHARPATMFAEVVRAFRARVTIRRDEGTPVDLASVLSVVGLDVRQGDRCRIHADGPEASAAIRAVEAFVRDRLPHADDAAPAPAPGAAPSWPSLPVALRATPVQLALGQPAGGGIGFGAAVPLDGLAPRAPAQPAGPVEAELASFHTAVTGVSDDLARRAAREAGLVADLIRAHRAMADDPALRHEIQDRIRAGSSAADAVIAAAEAFASRLRGAQSAYIRERAVDVLDVGDQVLQRLQGAGPAPAAPRPLPGPSVVFADLLTPSQLLGLDPHQVRGLVLGAVGPTSHVVILARSRGLPTVIGVPDVRRLAAPGTPVFVDGDAGLVAPAPAESTRRYFEREARARDLAADRVNRLAQGPARTRDDVTIEVAVNASLPDEVGGAVARGADGVGLLRTELLFLDRDAAPDEEEQYLAYAAVVRAAAGRPVIIRTFDIGGDKPATYLPHAPEANPFLGVRGARLYPAHQALLDSQLRAILRAGAHGPVSVMAPMIATPAEAAWFKARVQDARAALAARGVPVAKSLPLGIMLEVPAVATVVDQLAEHVEFFSLGTNDLCQYWMAAERGNPGVAALGDPRQPSFLRLLKLIVAGARAHNRWVGVCGEMAGDPKNLPLMIGLGVNEISVAPGAVAPLKAAIKAASAHECRRLLDLACMVRSAEEVSTLLDTPAWRSTETRPITEPELIAFGSSASAKEEAIHEAACLLVAQGRAAHTRTLEDAIWAREATYSTGLGFGFAVPHAACADVLTPSLAVVRLATPIPWGSLDGQPVHMVFMLVMPASDQAGAHMRFFAALARRLMHESFRERLLAADSPDQIHAALRDELGLA